jgi:hypothetical protein
MTLKFAFQNNKDTQWIAVLLGHEMPAERTPAAPKKTGPEV